MVQGRSLRGLEVYPAPKATILVLELENVKRHLWKNEVTTAIIVRSSASIPAMSAMSSANKRQAMSLPLVFIPKHCSTRALTSGEITREKRKGDRTAPWPWHVPDSMGNHSIPVVYGPMPGRSQTSVIARAGRAQS
jgi:hypothetical protein